MELVGAISAPVAEELALPMMSGTRVAGEPYQPADNTALRSGSLRDLSLDMKAAAREREDGKDGKNTHRCS